jgi:hypothetical protein
MTRPGTPPVDLNSPHPSLRNPTDAGSLLMPNAHRNVNGDTASRLTLVGTLEEMTRSARSMSHWLESNAMALRVAGVGIEDVRRVRNLIARLAPAVHGVAEQIVNQKQTVIGRR